MTPISKFLIGRTQFFFSPKVFSGPYRHIERKKNRKKKHFPKSGRDPMDRPSMIERSSFTLGDNRTSKINEAEKNE